MTLTSSNFPGHLPDLDIVTEWWRFPRQEGNTTDLNIHVIQSLEHQNILTLFHEILSGKTG